MFYELKSSRSIATLAREFADAARQEGFGTLGTFDLHAKLNEKGVAFLPHCLIFEVCDPKQAKAVLDADPRMASALPCRIAAHDIGGQVLLSTILPGAMLPPDAVPALKIAAADVEVRLKRVLQALQ